MSEPRKQNEVGLSQAKPQRGEVWWAYLDPTRGHEQAGRRPIVIISADAYHEAATGLVLIVPLTSRQRSLPSRVPIDPLNGGLKVASDALLDQLRSISTERLGRRIGSLDPRTLQLITTGLRFLLDLS